MEQQQTHRNKKLAVILTIVPIFLTFVGGFFAYNKLQTQTAPKETKPLFTFEESKAPGWWAADNWHGDAHNSTETESKNNALITGRNFFSGTREQPGTCFAMYFYKEGQVDSVAEIRNIEENTTNQDGTTGIQKLSTQNYTMQTPDGAKEFVLYQYELIGADAEQSAKGNQYAFVPLNKGYIEIRSTCETAEQLSETLPVFKAIGLKE